MVDVYHEFDFPYEMTESMLPRASNPAGAWLCVEFRGEDPKFPIKPVHRMTVCPGAKGNVTPAFAMASRPLNLCPGQHIIIFTEARKL